MLVDRHIGFRIENVQLGRLSILFAGALAALTWLGMLLVGGPGWINDRAVLASIYAGDSPLLAEAAMALTHFGGWIILTIVTAAAATFLFIRGERRRAFLLLAIIISGRALVEAQKYWTARARPEELDRLVSVHSLSFPSGHSANSTIVYLAVALLALPRRESVAAALILSILIGLSRLLLGVHWPSDVIGGWAFGLLWTFALVRFAERKGTPPHLLH